MIRSLKLDPFFKFILRDDVWAYESFFFFFALITMKVNNQLSWTFYLTCILVLHILFFSPLIFAHFESRIEESMKKSLFWGIWLLAFVILPLSIFLLFPVSGSVGDLYLQKTISVGEHFTSRLNYFEVLIPMLIIFFLLRFTRFQKSKGKVARKLRKISFLRLTISVIAIFSFLLPVITNSFQAIATDLNTAELIWIYFKSVPQIFTIYFSYYIFFYLNHKFLFPLIFEQKGILPYIIGLAGMILVITPILNRLIIFFPVVYELRIHPLGTGISLFDDINYFFPILVVILSFPVIVLIEWNKKTIAMKELEREKSHAELLLLKQQINPHFFFNTLNNLYSLSLDKSDQAPETILKLSKLMRFVIYRGQQDFVRLSEEVSYLQDYVGLQRIRLSKEAEVKFSVDIENSALEIPPLLFINLVENAFKHGIEVTNKPGFLKIDLIERGGRISFICENSIDEDETHESTGGIGLLNLRKRLEIRYPGRHMLKMDKTSKSFKAQLEITL